MLNPGYSRLLVDFLHIFKNLFLNQELIKMKKMIVAGLLKSAVFTFFPVARIRVSSPAISTTAAVASARELANRGLKKLNVGVGSNLPEWNNTATANIRAAEKNLKALADVVKKTKAVENEIRRVQKEIKAAASNFFNATDQLEKQYWMDKEKGLMVNKKCLMDKVKGLMDEKIFFLTWRETSNHL